MGTLYCLNIHAVYKYTTSMCFYKNIWYIRRPSEKWLDSVVLSTVTTVPW